MRRIEKEKDEGGHGEKRKKRKRKEMERKLAAVGGWLVGCENKGKKRETAAGWFVGRKRQLVGGQGGGRGVTTGGRTERREGRKKRREGRTERGTGGWKDQRTEEGRGSGKTGGRCCGPSFFPSFVSTHYEDFCI